MNQKEREEIEKFFRKNCDLRDAIDWLNKVIKRNGLERYNYINRISNSSNTQEKGLFYCIKAYYMTLPFTRWLKAERPSKRHIDIREEVVFNPHDETWEEMGGGTVYGARELDINGHDATASTSRHPQRTKKSSSKKILKRKSKRKSGKATTKKKSKRKSISKKSNKKRKSKKKSVSKRFKRSH